MDLQSTFTALLNNTLNLVLSHISYYLNLSAQSITNDDLVTFKPVLDAWKPPSQKPTILLRWLITEWCNNCCPYCNQDHSRYASKGRRYTSHAFDNYSVEQWKTAFSRHFGNYNLSLVLTGGEPMLDVKSMMPLLQFLAAQENVSVIRIDTNTSWNPENFSELEKSKIILMCTFHPSQISESGFINRIDNILLSGFRIGMINYVMDGNNFAKYATYKRLFRERSVPLHPNPLWDSRGIYSKDDVDLLKRELPLPDFLYRTKTCRTQKRKCLFPSLGYEMDYCGSIWVGCHRLLRGNIFKNRIPTLFSNPVLCPKPYCVCLDKYSFLIDVNRNVGRDPLSIYSELLLNNS